MRPAFEIIPPFDTSCPPVDGITPDTKPFEVRIPPEETNFPLEIKPEPYTLEGFAAYETCFVIGPYLNKRK